MEQLRYEPTQRRIEGTGHMVETKPVDRIPPYDNRSNNHYWIVTTAYLVDPRQWTSNDPTVTPLLDTENLVLVVGPGCYYCEEVYTPRLAHRRCPGLKT